MHYCIGILMLWLHMGTEVFARAGGGGGSGSGDGGGLIIGLILYGIYHVRRKQLLKKAEKNLAEALSIDSSWNIKKLKEMTSSVFKRYQSAWMDKDLEEIQNFSTKDYLEKSQKTLSSKLKGKKNIIKDIHISGIKIISVRDILGKDGDMFTMEITASMIDYTIDENTGEFVRSTLPKKKKEGSDSYQKRATTESHGFVEYWSFIRYNNTWRLMNISQQMSILVDVIGLSHLLLLKVLRKETHDQDVDDSMFYKVD